MTMFEDFESAALDTVVNTTNFTDHTQSVVATGGATCLVKTRSGSTPGENKHARLDLPAASYWSIGRDETAASALWICGYVRWGATPSALQNFFKGYDSATALGDGLCVTSGSAISLRDGSTTRWTSTGVSPDTPYRVSMLLSPGTDEARVKIYAGANLHTQTATQDSGLVALTSITASTVSRFRWGCIAGAAGIGWIEFDNIHIGTSEWLPATVNGDVQYDITGNYAANSSTVASWSVDTTGSVGTMTLTQTSGTTATVVGPSAGVFTITNPGGTDQLVFDLKADADTDETVELTFPRGGGTTTQRPAMVTKQSNGTWV